MSEFVIRGRRGWHVFLLLSHLGLIGASLYLTMVEQEIWLYALTGTSVLFALIHLIRLLRSLTPIFVADDQGVRLRSGKQWFGIVWSSVSDLRIEPRGWNHPARIVITTREQHVVYVVGIGAATTASVGHAQVELSARYPSLQS